MALTEISGWIGTLLLLTAYGLTSSGRVSAQSATYHLINVAGAVAVAVNVIAHKAWSISALELCWAVIGLVSLARIAASRSRAGP
ncbi:CBU_0592 family membrane protein [Sphingomonas sp. GlSt437]|uniref:CBU_0592 family membrane protein n=1 Tax=Sphingomonas sp. GlSt437 TaxID=3389970 RepID=UPI003A8B1CE3